MRAGVAQGEGLTLAIASSAVACSSYDQWLFQQHRFGELSATQLSGGERAVPETEEHERIRRLGLQWELVGHRKGEDTAAGEKLEPPARKRGRSKA